MLARLWACGPLWWARLTCRRPRAAHGWRWCGGAAGSAAVSGGRQVCGAAIGGARARRSGPQLATQRRQEERPHARSHLGLLLRVEPLVVVVARVVPHRLARLEIKIVNVAVRGLTAPTRGRGGARGNGRRGERRGEDRAAWRRAAWLDWMLRCGLVPRRHLSCRPALPSEPPLRHQQSAPKV